ncbi:MAG TPA: hypothetical protein VMU90_13115 [Solirubrobacteraceae bacterium]|nr:hypothetical protein [Solirubrobacteraceae bacterium]
MRIGELLRDLGRPIAFYPTLVPVCGSVHATLFLCQLLYWEGKQRDPDGWIYKSQRDMEEETGLSRFMQDEARKKLKERRLIEEARRGVPATMHYRIDHQALEDEWLRTRDSQTRLLETSKLDVGKPPNWVAGNQQTISETTPETTRETVPSPRLMQLWAATIDGVRLPQALASDVHLVQPVSWSDGRLVLRAPLAAVQRRWEKRADELVRLLSAAAPVALAELAVVTG